MQTKEAKHTQEKTRTSLHRNAHAHTLKHSPFSSYISLPSYETHFTVAKSEEEEGGKVPLDGAIAAQHGLLLF